MLRKFWVPRRAVGFSVVGWVVSLGRTVKFKLLTARGSMKTKQCGSFGICSANWSVQLILADSLLSVMWSFGQWDYRFGSTLCFSATALGRSSAVVSRVAAPTYSAQLKDKQNRIGFKFKKYDRNIVTISNVSSQKSGVDHALIWWFVIFTMKSYSVHAVELTETQLQTNFEPIFF